MPNVFYAYLFVAGGGALGAVARYTLNLALQRGTTFPWGTLSANLLGCLLMGCFLQLAASASWFNDTGWIPEQHRLLFAVGFCGSFTTLSSMVMEISGMMQRGDLAASFAYLFATLLGGFASFYLGALVVRAVLQSS